MSTVTRIGCAWGEILVTVDGFGSALWEKGAQSQGFGMRGIPCGRGGGSANPETGIIHAESDLAFDKGVELLDDFDHQIHNPSLSLGLFNLVQSCARRGWTHPPAHRDYPLSAPALVIPVSWQGQKTI